MGIGDRIKMEVRMDRREFLADAVCTGFMGLLGGCAAFRDDASCRFGGCACDRDSFGAEAVRKVFGDTVQCGGRPVHEKLMRGDAAELLGRWRGYMERKGACPHCCDRCPGWVLPVYENAGYHCVYDVVSRDLPTCYAFATKDRDLAEAKFNERLATSGASLVSTNHPIGMVRGFLAASEKYEALHPRFGKAFAFLRSHDLAKLPSGRHAIDGDDVYANVSDAALKTWDPDAKLEVHRKYFDIHVPVSGEEVSGFVYNAERAKAADFNVADDYALFQNPKMAKVAVKKGEFVIFYPNCGAHAPNKTEGAPRIHRKIVLKVRA